jgi:hypothetical protein
MPANTAERERFLGYISELMRNPDARDAFNANPTYELGTRGFSVATKDFLHEEVALNGRSEIIMLLDAAIDAWAVPVPTQAPGVPKKVDGCLFFLIIALWNDPLLVQEYVADPTPVLERFRVPALDRTALLNADKAPMKQAATNYFSSWTPQGPWVSQLDPPGCDPVEPALGAVNPMAVWGDPVAYVDRVTPAQAPPGAIITVHGGGFQPTATVSLGPTGGGADIRAASSQLKVGSTFRCAELVATLPGAVPPGVYRIVVRNPTKVLPAPPSVTLTVT